MEVFLIKNIFIVFSYLRIIRQTQHVQLST